ncbi:hypothetical protein [Pseudonocardia sp. WMMC193]|nr:hypothetical protein [Pseudonocardia sp. WMMC193]
MNVSLMDEHGPPAAQWWYRPTPPPVPAPNQALARACLAMPPI